MELNKKQQDILFNFAACITKKQIEKLMKNDKDFKYTLEEYNELFQEIFDMGTGIK